MAGLLNPQSWATRFGTDAPVTTGLLAAQPGTGLLAPQSELRAYQPTARDWLQGQITNLFGGGREASNNADKVMTLLSRTRGTGCIAEHFHV